MGYRSIDSVQRNEDAIAMLWPRGYAKAFALDDGM